MRRILKNGLEINGIKYHNTMSKKRTYKGNFDFSDLINDHLRASAKATDFNGNDFSGCKTRKGGHKIYSEDSGDSHLGGTMEAVMNLRINGQVACLLSAPKGWNNYLRTGNFIGCRPIIKPGAKFNMRAFETINFEIV